MYETIKDACREWVNGFDRVPRSVLEKLITFDDSVHEITPVAIGDHVYCTDPDEKWREGEVIDRVDNGFVVKFDDDSETKTVSENYVEVMREDTLPMWCTLWSFGEQIDEEWARGTFCESHLQEMADLGFRLYETEDFGLVFGIDGAGYDFYEAHWIPLYKARGLKWHKETA